MEKKANECKMLIDYIPGYSIAKCTSISTANFIKFKKTIRENLYFVHLLCLFVCLFLSFFVFFFTDELNVKTMVCMRTFHTPNDCSASRASFFSGLGWRMRYDWQSTAMKLQVTSPKMHVLGCRLVGFLFNYYGHGRYMCIVRPLSAWNSESRSSTIVYFISLALKTNSVQLKTLPFGSPQRDSIHF